jgi:hypothetical protein
VRVSADVPMKAAAKARLVLRIWYLFVYVHYGLRKNELPAFVTTLSHRRALDSPSDKPPTRLGGIVYKVLNVGPLHPRCLIMCLVFFALLRDDGLTPELVIGLPDRPTDREAHSWVELDGRVVGPPPGRSGHVELVRYS